MEATLLKALAKEPRDRFPSGAALVAALESANSHTMLPETVPQQTIPQRVSLLERPLPPLSAEANKPDPQADQKVEPTNTIAVKATPIPAQAATATTSTATATESITETPLIPTETASPIVTSLPTATPTSETPYHLLIATNGEDSLFVVNQSDEAFPVASLQLGDGNGAIQGVEWGVEFLEPGSCVTAWKDGGNPQPPAVNCHQVGERLTRDGSNRFWKNAFEVFYAGTPVSSCSQAQCVTEIVK